jgi:hypothetical protein
MTQNADRLEAVASADKRFTGPAGFVYLLVDE